MLIYIIALAEIKLGNLGKRYLILVIIPIMPLKLMEVMPQGLGELVLLAMPRLLLMLLIYKEYILMIVI